MAQDDTVFFKNKTTPHFQFFNYVLGWPVLITHSWGAAFTVTKKSYSTYNVNLDLWRMNKKCHKHVTNAPKGIGLA